MGFRDLTDKAAILKAIGESDRLGRDAFPEKYGLGRSKKCVLHYPGIRASRLLQGRPTA
jgi:hypothetical protein